MDSIIEKRMQNLITKLNEATKAYDKGAPIISDKEWDEMYFKLVSYEEYAGESLPNSPTRKIIYEIVNNLEKIEHNHPMLSLDKTKEVSDVESFVENNDFIGMAKMDGLTCSLKYINGNLVSAETRGDGHIGENILHNVKVIKNVPKTITYKDELIIDGEIICTYKNFEPFDEKNGGSYKNPRNFASGKIRSLNSEECAKSNLSFIAWDVIKGFDVEENTTLSSKLILLQAYDFSIVPFITKDSETNIYTIIGKLKETSLDYPIDGIVFKYNNIDYYKSLGATDHHFRGGLAFKFYDEEYETKLTDIELSIGRTGQLTPVAIYEPVDADGSTIERASLHNLSVMNELLGTHPYIGQKIKVCKQNEIIPQVIWADKENIDYEHLIKFHSCPICGGDIEVKNNNGVITLWCGNPACDGKLINRIDHFVGKKGLDVKGLSKSTIEKLIEWGWLGSIRELFSLSNFEKEWKSKPGFGEKSVNNILSSIEVSKQTRVEQFISGLGIHLIGSRVAKEIVKYYPTWEDFRAAVGGKWSDLEGFGYEMEQAINNFDYAEADEIAKILIFKSAETVAKESNKPSLEGLSFCITGKLSRKRDEIKADIESAGGKVTDSVSSKTSYLICNDKDSTTGKASSAKKLGTPIITEEEFKKLFDF